MSSRFSMEYFRASARCWFNDDKGLDELRTLFGRHDVATTTPSDATSGDFRLTVNEWTCTFMPCLPEALALTFVGMRRKELCSLDETRELHAEFERRFHSIISE